MRLHHLIAAAVSVGLCQSPSPSLGQPTAGATSDPSRADYAAATKLLYPNLKDLVRNGAVSPHWIGDDGRFWYQRDGQDGPEYVTVTAKGVKSRALDRAGLEQALHAAMGEQPAGKGSDPAPTAPELLPSPDGRRALLTHDHNLFVRDLRSGEEHALTTDGAPTWSWAGEPYYASFVKLATLNEDIKSPPFQTYWSPDGRYVIAPRVDERGVKLWPYVEWVPIDGSQRPIVHNVRSPLPGDRETVKLEYYLFDLKSGERKAIHLPEGYPEFSWSSEWAPVLGWSGSRGQAFILARTPGWKSAAVFRVELATAQVTKVVEES